MKYKIESTFGHSFMSDGGSILDAALRDGLVYEYSCRTGRCGVCKTTLLKGEVKELQSQLSLTDGDISSGKILTCCCEPLTDILVDAEDLTALHDIETKTLPARIDDIRKLSSSIIEVSLRLPPSSGFRFLEGQYIDVIGPGAVRRSYSIASPSAESIVKLLVKKVDNGVMSNYWFNEAKVGDLLRIEGPKGTFFIRDDSKPMIFMATGTGIAPIVSMLTSMDMTIAEKQNTSIYLFWGNRGYDDFIWMPEFNNLNLDLCLVLSKPTRNWGGEVGYVQDVALSNIGDVEHFDVYACGSNDMIKSAKNSFLEAGLPENSFYSDAFVQSF